jgi:ketosteroid isomerase-like protein
MTDDAKIVAELDTRFQAAVKANDARTMDEILHDEMILVTGNGSVFTKTELVEEAKSKRFVWEHQEEHAGTQKVRMFGDTAIVTAKLWMKGMIDGKPSDRTVWFSDTYVRTPKGWKYAFGQSSLALPQGQ